MNLGRLLLLLAHAAHRTAQTTWDFIPLHGAECSWGSVLVSLFIFLLHKLGVQ